MNVLRFCLLFAGGGKEDFFTGSVCALANPLDEPRVRSEPGVLSVLLRLRGAPPAAEPLSEPGSSEHPADVDLAPRKSPEKSPGRGAEVLLQNPLQGGSSVLDLAFWKTRPLFSTLLFGVSFSLKSSGKHRCCPFSPWSHADLRVSLPGVMFEASRP